jgi:hypothetical protein
LFFSQLVLQQEAGVQYILDSVIPQLEADPKKRFTYVEIAFFSRWWFEQTPAMQARVRALVDAGRLEFQNGGWTMNDEASVSDEAIITQMSIGHMFLKETFGKTPTTAIQYDPFGHSAAYASLASQMGMSAIFFARIGELLLVHGDRFLTHQFADYQDYARRKATKQLEFVWRPSVSLGARSGFCPLMHVFLCFYLFEKTSLLILSTITHIVIRVISTLMVAMRPSTMILVLKASFLLPLFLCCLTFETKKVLTFSKEPISLPI